MARAIKIIRRSKLYKLIVMWGVVLAIVILCVQPRAQASVETYGGYVPIYVPHTGEVYNQGVLGLPIISLKYVKQYDQVDFKVCAQLIGDGVWLLTYPGVGDPVYFSYSTYTWDCIDTTTGLGGGIIGQNLQLWLTQGTGQTVHLLEPNIFVSTKETTSIVSK
jgi:hypothetical protein